MLIVSSQTIGYSFLCFGKGALGWTDYKHKSTLHWACLCLELETINVFFSAINTSMNDLEFGAFNR